MFPTRTLAFLAACARHAARRASAALAADKGEVDAAATFRPADGRQAAAGRRRRRASSARSSASRSSSAVIYGLYWVLKQVKASREDRAPPATAWRPSPRMPLGTEPLAAPRARRQRDRPARRRRARRHPDPRATARRRPARSASSSARGHVDVPTRDAGEPRPAARPRSGCLRRARRLRKHGASSEDRRRQRRPDPAAARRHHAGPGAALHGHRLHPDPRSSSASSAPASARRPRRRTRSWSASRCS